MGQAGDPAQGWMQKSHVAGGARRAGQGAPPAHGPAELGHPHCAAITTAPRGHHTVHRYFYQQEQHQDMSSWRDSRHSSTAVVLWHTKASPNLTPMFRLSTEERDVSLSTRRVTSTLVMAGDGSF